MPIAENITRPYAGFPPLFTVRGGIHTGKQRILIYSLYHKDEASIYKASLCKPLTFFSATSAFAGTTGQPVALPTTGESDIQFNRKKHFLKNTTSRWLNVKNNVFQPFAKQFPLFSDATKDGHGCKPIGLVLFSLLAPAINDFGQATPAAEA